MAWPTAPMQPALTLSGAGFTAPDTWDYVLSRDPGTWEIGLVPGVRYCCYHEGPLAFPIVATVEVTDYDDDTDEGSGTVLSGTTRDAPTTPPTGSNAWEARDVETGRTYGVTVAADLGPDDAITVTFGDAYEGATPATFEIRERVYMASNVQMRWRTGTAQIIFDDTTDFPPDLYQHYLENWIDLVSGGYTALDGAVWVTFALGAQVGGGYGGVLAGAQGWHLNPLFGGSEDFATAWDGASGEAVYRPYARASMDMRLWPPFSVALGEYRPPRESGALSASGYAVGLIGSSGSHNLSPRPEIGRGLTTPTGWVSP